MSSDGASASACAPSRIELLRGSSRHHDPRASPSFARRPASVVAIAVGWWAKSSYTVMPACSPITSIRRLTLRKSASDATTAATSTPTALQAASAARPLSTLWSPSMRPFDGAELVATMQDHESAAVIAQLACAPFEPGLEAETLHRRPAAHREYFAQALVVAVDDQPAAPRHGAHQVVELALDRGHVREDVGVVVLEVVEDRDQRAVVDELAALVEEGGVVLVGLDHEFAAAAEPRGHAEVFGHAADQEAGRAAGAPAAGRPGSWWSWSCRGCRPPPARRGRAAPARSAIAHRRCSCRPASSTCSTASLPRDNALPITI